MAEPKACCVGDDGKARAPLMEDVGDGNHRHSSCPNA